MSVYRGGALVGCATGSTARVPLRVAPGAYLVQVGTKGSDVAGLGAGPMTVRADFVLDPDVDNDGELASTDCNDANPAIRHGVVDTPDDGIDQDCNGADAINLDRDRDGESRPGDCDDANPAINHRARDIPGNRIDEDCSGSPAPFRRIRSTVRTAWRFQPFQLTKLIVVDAERGSRVTITCEGGGCPFARERIKVKRSRKERSCSAGDCGARSWHAARSSRCASRSRGASASCAGTPCAARSRTRRSSSAACRPASARASAAETTQVQKSGSRSLSGPSGLRPPMQITSIPSGPASNERTTAGATRSTSQVPTSMISSSSFARPDPATTT